MTLDPIEEHRRFEKKAQALILTILFGAMAAESAFWINHAMHSDNQTEPVQKALVSPASAETPEFVR